MNSPSPDVNWLRQVRAILRKEFRTEVRSPHGLLTGLIFSFLAVIAISMAAFNLRIGPTMAAGLFWVVLLFAGIANVVRSFITEEENGTADLLRMVSDPFTVYWGKALFSGILMLANALLIALLFGFLMNLQVGSLGLLAASLFGGAIAVSGAVTLCSALAARAANRQGLAAMLSLPLTIPIAVWGVSSLRVAFGEGGAEPGRVAALGLIAYGVISNAVGPYIYAALWKT